MNKFNTLDTFQISNENKDKFNLIEINEKNKKKEMNIKKNSLIKNNLVNSNKYLPKLEFLPKLSNTIKTNNYFVNSFRTKYTCEKLKSIQISAYDINTNINNNISNNSNDNNDKNIFCKSYGTINLVKSIESMNSINSNNNYMGISKSQSNDNNMKINEKQKNKLNEIKTIKLVQKEKNNNKDKNNCILNPDYYCTYNFPFKKLSYDEEIKRNVNKFNSFVQKKINFQKYSNLSMIPNQITNKKNIFMDKDNKCNNNNNNVISISDNIEESIHSHFSNYGNKLLSDSNKPNSSKITNKNKNSEKLSEKENDTENNGFIIETNNKISLALDNIVGKIIKGKLFSWVVGDIIYESGNSTIYKAFDINDGNIFAVKKYNCEDGAKCENYFNEVKIYEHLNHPNVIKYIYSEQISNYYFLYLEYIPGGSIKSMIEQFGGFNEILIRKYTKQILSGLKYLHDKKIIHRDIKCANILIGNGGIIKLTDFGCSKKISMKLAKKDSSSNGEYCTSLKGTIPWCAPEVICHKKYGKKADIWSLGCTLIEMTGNQPWGNIENIFQVMNKIGKSNLTPDIPDCLSNNFKNFLKLCFKRDPKQRANLKLLMKHNFITGFYL